MYHSHGKFNLHCNVRDNKWIAILLLLVVKLSYASGRYVDIRTPAISLDRKTALSFRGGSSGGDEDDGLAISEASVNDEDEATSTEDSEISPDVDDVSPTVAEEIFPEVDESPKEANPHAPRSPEKKKSLLSQSAIERIGGAVILLIALSAIISIFGINGMVGLCLASQFAMFQEVYSVVSSASNISKYQKWLSFATVLCFTSLRALSETNQALITCMFPSSNAIQWVGYALTMLTLLSSVLSMEYNAQRSQLQSSSDTFKSILGSQVTTLFTLLFLLSQSSFWIYTLQLSSQNNSNYGLQCIIYSLLLVIINDTMAYICGKAVGKTPLLPNLSPNKTVEGFIGAAFFTIAFSPFLWTRIISNSSEVPKPNVIILALFASFIAPFGGFLASAVKRSFGAKDFGTLIPGHGGVMDRLDCHLIMAPFTYMYLSKLQP